MTNKKEIYEELILASPLFSLDKERESSAYKREALKMVENLYLYLLATNEEKYIDYGLEITETANKCILNFDSSCGSFLHYFNAAMAKEYRRASAKRQIDEIRHGIHISDGDDKNIRKILRFMEARGITNPTDKQISLIAQALKLSESSVSECIVMNDNSKALSDVTINDDGESVSLFDTLASDEKSFEEQAEEDENLKRRLYNIEKAYLDCQDRQKPIISAMMTVKVCKIICEYQISTEGLSFINRDIIIKFIKTGVIPSQREIAEKFDKKEASVSRTVSAFLEKIKEG